MSRHRRGERLLRAAARLALYAYPVAFRREYGDDLVALFADLHRHGRSRPRSGPLRGWLTLVRGGIAERLGLPLQPGYRLPRPSPTHGFGGSLVIALLHDLKLALRTLLGRPGFSLLVVAMLALGVAANAAVFSAFDSIFLRPMPFADPDRLVDLDVTAPAWNLEYVGISYPDFYYWRQRNRTFTGMAVYSGNSFNLADGGRADRVAGAVVDWSLLDVLGLEPILGRGFTAADDTEGAPPVAMISAGLWRERYDADPGIVGSTVRLDAIEHTIVGVLPDAAVIPVQARVWVPVSTLSSCCSPDEGVGSWWLRGVGRLRHGVTLEQARADLERVHAGLVELFGDSRKIATPRLQPLLERYAGDRRPILLTLLGAVGILLLIACANVGGLMLARAASRGREMGIRRALGAGTGRLVRQLLTESLLLATLGGLLGVALGYRAMAALFRAMPEDARGWIHLGLGWRFALFAVGACAGTALLFGLVPAVSASRTAPGTALREGRRGSAGKGRRRALAVLVVAEVSLSVVLLVGAGLLVQAFRGMLRIDPGFRGDVLTVGVGLPDSAYPERADAVAFFERVGDAVASLPGVEASGVSTLRPLSGHSGWFVKVEDGVEFPEGSNPVVLTRFATSSYFDAMGIRFQSGAPYREAEPGRDAPLEVIVNETFARTFWDRADVVGNRLHIGGDDMPWLRVAGVVRDTRHYGLDEPMRPGIFLPFDLDLGDRSGASIAVRGGDDPSVFADDVRKIVASVDPDVAVAGVGTMAEHLRESTWSWRMYAGLLGSFAVGALLLALGGIYSTVSYAVSQRRREIGIRIALGARDRQVLGQVVREGMFLAGAGLGIGLLLAFLAAGLVSTTLLGASPGDPLIYGGVTVLLVAATLLANLVPARRAAGTSPVRALKVE